MVILRAFLALAGGFALLLILSTLCDALLKRLAPAWAATEGRPVLGAVVVNLGGAFLAAAAGGYLTAALAQGSPHYHALALAIVVLALAALSALQQTPGAQPVWYTLALVAVSPLGVMAGGLLRLRMLGIL